MKKFLLGALLVVGTTCVAYASDYTSNFSDVEAAYNALKAEEAILIEQRREEAESAQVVLDEQKRVYAELRQREAKLLEGKKYKYYKKEYRELGKQYAGMRKELESEMAVQEEIINAYRIISSN
ncbi:adhesion protein FadA [Fusobacterium sp. PH5-44]|uniref:adhesion protein FadA n=1 Tax=unclassified Fusobacterium TaxID=2648384 RepID=UPI003D24319B